jgi:hypothetical protein
MAATSATFTRSISRWQKRFVEARRRQDITYSAHPADHRESVAVCLYWLAIGASLASAATALGLKVGISGRRVNRIDPSDSRHAHK